jgi:hypothetical protein
MWQETDGSRFALMLGATVLPLQRWCSSRGFVLLAACRLVSTDQSIARVSTISPRPSSLISRSVGCAGENVETSCDGKHLWGSCRSVVWGSPALQSRSDVQRMSTCAISPRILPHMGRGLHVQNPMIRSQRRLPPSDKTHIARRL